MNESLVKYLAGLLDADGCLSFNYAKIRSKEGSDRRTVQLRLVLSASKNVDKLGFIPSLPELTGVGTTYTMPPNDSVNAWCVAKRSDLEILLPRLIKHMVIKARHWQWLLDEWRLYRGKEWGERGVTPEERELMSERAKASRLNVGPIKPKNHPSWAWLAGYLDGDGWYSGCFKSLRRGSRRIGAAAHKNDASVLEFISKAFGGTVSVYPKNPNLVVWHRNAGHSQTSFALKFLPNLAKHSRLKRPKIDQMIRWHRQRLSESVTTCSHQYCYAKIYSNGECQTHYNRKYTEMRRRVKATV